MYKYKKKKKHNCKNRDLSLAKQLHSFLSVLSSIEPDDDPFGSK